MATRLEPVGAAALVGVALWQLHEAYQREAPDLTELRRADRNCTDHRQRLVDADLLTGGLALLAGGTASWLMRSWVPVAVVAAAFAWISGYHHLIMRSPTITEIEDRWTT